MLSGFVSRRASLRGVIAAAAALPFVKPSLASSADRGLVVLTVGGLVGAPNRPPLNPKRDRLFRHNNLDFRQARAYAWGDLLALPQHSALVADESGESSVFKGPSLQDVLTAAKPLREAKTARLSALDGYAAEIPLDTVARDGWFLALEAGGEAFGIGDFGPLYAVRPLPEGEKRSEEEEANWVFSLYYIELMP